MSIPAIIFICCLALIMYAYIGYPLVAWVAARVVGRPLTHLEESPRAFSVIIAAYNEEKTIARRVRELLDQLRSTSADSEIIVVSDGSTDRTAELVEAIDDARVSLIRQPANMGKAMALNTGVAAALNDIVVFADARQQWAPDAIERMAENFSDPCVGAVSGDLVFRNDDGSLAGVGLYWKIESWVRRSESRWHSCVQVAGAICAVRRELFEPIPRGIILDDLCWPLGVTMRGYRVIHDSRATAFDRLPEKARDEIRRKVRTLSGNFQLLFRKPAIIAPWANRAWFCVVSHKLLRLVVPWAMIGALAASAVAPEPAVRVLFVAQLATYVLGTLGLLWPSLAWGRVINALASLLMLNAAALMSWFVYFGGRSQRSWKKVVYAEATGSLQVES